MSTGKKLSCNAPALPNSKNVATAALQQALLAPKITYRAGIKLRKKAKRKTKVLLILKIH